MLSMLEARYKAGIIFFGLNYDGEHSDWKGGYFSPITRSKWCTIRHRSWSDYRGTFSIAEWLDDGRIHHIRVYVKRDIDSIIVEGVLEVIEFLDACHDANVKRCEVENLARRIEELKQDLNTAEMASSYLDSAVWTK